MTTPKRRGRPPKPPEERKGGNLTFRTRADFRERLEEAAAQSGRSVTEEVELRVERSFESEVVQKRLNDVVGVFYDHGAVALNFVTSVMSSVGTLGEAKSPDGRRLGSEVWGESRPMMAGVRAAVLRLLEHYAPEAALQPLDGDTPQMSEDIARMKAHGDLLARIATGRADDVIDMVMRQSATSTGDN